MSACVSLAELCDTPYRQQIAATFVGQLRKQLSLTPYRLRRILEGLVATKYVFCCIGFSMLLAGHDADILWQSQDARVLARRCSRVVCAHSVIISG